MIEGGAGKAQLGPAAAGEAAPGNRALVLLKNAALFFAAPFIGLAHAIAFPFVGAALLIWRAANALGKRTAAE